MSKPPNVRSKSPRQLASDVRAPGRGLNHAFRWGAVRRAHGEVGEEPSESASRTCEPPPSRSLGMQHTSRWGLTPSSIAPESLRSHPLGSEPGASSETSRANAMPARGPASGRTTSAPGRWLEEPSATPPPVALSTGGPLSRRSLVPPPLPPEPAEIQGRSDTRRWVAASLFATLLVGSGLVLRQVKSGEAERRGPLANTAALTAPASPGSASTTERPTAGGDAPAAEEAEDGVEEVALPPSKPGGFRATVESQATIDGGTVEVPASFAPREGGYDLVVHFHGEAGIVRESVEHLGLNAALAVVDLGTTSSEYARPFEEPGRFERLLAQVHSRVRQRGFRGIRLRRLALSAWGEGAAAIASVLEHRRAPDAENDPLDAVLVLDGLRAERLESGHASERGLLPFLRAAKAAASDRIAFVATHSEAEPARAATATQSAELLLAAVGAKPLPSDGTTAARVDLRAARGALGNATTLEPTTVTRVGSLKVAGFRGANGEAHAAHLVQMAAVALPTLARRWKLPAPPRRLVADEPADDGEEMPSVERAATKSDASGRRDRASTRATKEARAPQRGELAPREDGSAGTGAGTGDSCVTRLR